MSRARVLQMVREVEEMATRRADQQLAADPFPFDPGCRGTGGPRERRRPSGLWGHHPRAAPLVAVLARLPEEDVDRLDALSKRTRVPRSEFLREAVADLIAKYEAAP